MLHENESSNRKTTPVIIEPHDRGGTDGLDLSGAVIIMDSSAIKNSRYMRTAFKTDTNSAVYARQVNPNIC